MLHRVVQPPAAKRGSHFGQNTPNWGAYGEAHYAPEECGRTERFRDVEDAWGGLLHPGPAAMTYRVSNIGIWLDEDESLLGKRAAEKLGIDAKSVGKLRVVRKILDARKRNHPRFVYQVDVQVEQ